MPAARAGWRISGRTSAMRSAPCAKGRDLRPWRSRRWRWASAPRPSCSPSSTACCSSRCLIRDPSRLVAVHGQTETWNVALYGEQNLAYLDFLDCQRDSRSLDSGGFRS